MTWAQWGRTLVVLVVLGFLVLVPPRVASTAGGDVECRSLGFEWRQRAGFEEALADHDPVTGSDLACLEARQDRTLFVVLVVGVVLVALVLRRGGPAGRPGGAASGRVHVPAADPGEER